MIKVDIVWEGSKFEEISLLVLTWLTNVKTDFVACNLLKFSVIFQSLAFCD